MFKALFLFLWHLNPFDLVYFKYMLRGNCRMWVVCEGREKQCFIWIYINVQVWFVSCLWSCVEINRAPKSSYFFITRSFNLKMFLISLGASFKIVISRSLSKHCCMIIRIYLFQGLYHYHYGQLDHKFFDCWKMKCCWLIFWRGHWSLERRQSKTKWSNVFIVRRC